MLLGWTVGLVSLALILRFGGRWGILAWSLPVLLMPFASVFYPESVLPPFARAIAQAVPANHVFEGMRTAASQRRDRVGEARARQRREPRLPRARFGAGGVGVPARAAPRAASEGTLTRRADRGVGLGSSREAVTRSCARSARVLCWAIVYADIGTSVYYVPGLLYRSVGTSAATFVLATSLAFVLLAEKYSDIAARYPGGGGVVSVAEEAFGPRMGALGGMLILVDYFLTAAISSISGFTYLATLVPVLQGFELPLAAGGLLLLGVLNWIGIRESAQVSAAIAVIAFVALLLLIGVTATQIDAAAWDKVRSAATAAGRIPIADAITGYAFAWLAFSGLESLAQISPAMGSAAPSHGRARDAAGRDRDPGDLAAAHGARDQPAGSPHGEPRRLPVRARLRDGRDLAARADRGVGVRAAALCREHGGGRHLPRAGRARRRRFPAAPAGAALGQVRHAAPRDRPRGRRADRGAGGDATAISARSALSTPSACSAPSSCPRSRWIACASRRAARGCSSGWASPPPAWC